MATLTTWSLASQWEEHPAMIKNHAMHMTLMSGEQQPSVWSNPMLKTSEPLVQQEKDL